MEWQDSLGDIINAIWLENRTQVCVRRDNTEKIDWGMSQNVSNDRGKTWGLDFGGRRGH